MNKKGVNAVVATVMLILIVVLGVGAIWMGIVPVVQENAEASVVDAEVRIQTDGGYTTWFRDEQKDEGEVCVQIKRGSDDSLISKILAKIEIDGDSYEEEFTNIPEPNSVVIQCFTKPVYKTKPDSIIIYPILDVKGREKVSSYFSEIYKNAIPEASKRQSEEGCESECGANEECYEGVCYDSTALLDSCQVLNEAGKTYILTNDLNLELDDLINKKCFIIEADSITLDFDNHIVTLLEEPPNNGFGYDEEHNAVSINNHDNFILKNGIVDSFSRAVYFQETVNSQIQNFDAVNNYDTGFYFDIVYDCQFSDLLSQQSKLDGIVLSRSDDINFEGVESYYNGDGGGDGIWIYSSTETFFNNVYSNQNYDEGFYVSSSSEVFLGDCDLRHNEGEYDLELSGSILNLVPGYDPYLGRVYSDLDSTLKF